MDYIVAVDGGGTKTILCAANIRQNQKLYAHTGCTNYKSVGIEAARENLFIGLENLLRAAKISLQDICYFVFGLSGNDSQEDCHLLTGILHEFGIKENYCLCNDSKLALYAATTAPGIVTISGTGSVVFGVDAKGAEVRLGGWGYDFSDLGSGYWIGRQALTYLLMYCEGYYPYSPLFTHIKDRCGVDDFAAFPSFLTAPEFSYKETAALAEVVIESAGRGERLPLMLVRKAALLLAKQTYAVYRQLDFTDKTVSVVLAGSVLKNPVVAALFERWLCQQLGPGTKVTLIPLQGEPVDGGIELGLACCGQ